MGCPILVLSKPSKPQSIHHAVRLLRWRSVHSSRLGPMNRITTTIIAPTPLIAANFVILGRMIEQLGPEYNRIGPHMCALCSVGPNFIENDIESYRYGHILLRGKSHFQNV